MFTSHVESETMFLSSDITATVVQMTNVMLLMLRFKNVRMPLVFLRETTVNILSVILKLHPDICFCGILIIQFNEIVKKPLQ